MIRYAPLFALLVGCTIDPVTNTPQSTAAWLGEADTYVQYGQADNPDASPWLIFKIEVDTWTIREGEDWTTGTELASLEIDNTEGLIVGGDRLLPADTELGASEDGVEVVAVEDTEVYYGEFLDALHVEVDSGRFAGAQVFGQNFGLISTTFDGQTWELVYYE